MRAATNFAAWRSAARPLLAAGIPPRDIEWDETGAPLAMSATRAAEAAAPGLEPPPRISAAMLTLLDNVSLYRAAGRWDLMYRLAWRCVNGHPQLLADAADPDVRHALLMERSVRRDVHKMHAFVRFRETGGDSGGSAYVAWFEPQHEILRRGAEFFVQRFPNHDWTIATPDGAAQWTARVLRIVASPHGRNQPPGDDCEDLWRTYYRNICNVARINPAAMQREMPQRYWRHLPEAAEIAALTRDAAGFSRRQRESPEPTQPMPLAVKRALRVPPAHDAALHTCRRCDLWRHATQPVPGEGAADAGLMLVGEQPGDEEDLRGHPFVGPAGALLDRALAATGLDRRRLFLTNAVKHFKWEPRGKRRLHKRPGTAEIHACNVWLEQEIAAVQPHVIVALGATALRALTGAALSVEDARRRPLHHAGGTRIVATYHPAAVLRADAGRAAELMALLDADLREAATLAAATSAAAPGSAAAVVVTAGTAPGVAAEAAPPGSAS